MRTYWDYSEKERLALSKEEVKALLDLHLMEKGVLKVKAPELVKIEEAPVLNQHKVFKVEAGYNAIAFECIEEAQAFIDLKPMKLDYDYSLDSKYLRAVPLESKVEMVMVYDRTELINASSILKSIKAAKENNDKLEAEFTKANTAVESCLNEVWNDYWLCKNTGEKHEKLINTWKEYLAMTNGDEKVASGFLKKAFSVEKIREASEWTGVSIPTEFLEMSSSN